MVAQAEPEVVQKIRELAATQRCRPTRRAKQDFIVYDVTRYEVLEAICKWIDSDKPVRKDFTRHDPRHHGKPIYIFKPIFHGKVFWVETAIERDRKTGDLILIISTHPSWGESREDGGSENAQRVSDLR